MALLGNSNHVTEFIAQRHFPGASEITLNNQMTVCNVPCVPILISQSWQMGI